MMNGVATSIRFLQQNIHERKNFAKKFSIDIIPEPRSFKYYNYLGYFWLACRTIFSLLPFCCRYRDIYNLRKIYRSKRSLQGYIWLQYYFLDHDKGNVTTLKAENHSNIYIFKTFWETLKKHNDPLLYDVLYNIAGSHGREEIYDGMKSNVIH